MTIKKRLLVLQEIERRRTRPRTRRLLRVPRATGRSQRRWTNTPNPILRELRMMSSTSALRS